MWRVVCILRLFSLGNVRVDALNVFFFVTYCIVGKNFCQMWTETYFTYRLESWDFDSGEQHVSQEWAKHEQVEVSNKCITIPTATVSLTLSSSHDPPPPPQTPLTPFLVLQGLRMSTTTKQKHYMIVKCWVLGGLSSTYIGIFYQGTTDFGILWQKKKWGRQ